jgi:hypothetical protein
MSPPAWPASCLTAKLWSVCQALRLAARDIAHALDRICARAGGGGSFQVTSGLLNITYWYSVMPFAFIIALLEWHGSHLARCCFIAVAADHPRRAHSSPIALAGDGLSRRGLPHHSGGNGGRRHRRDRGADLRPLTSLSVLAPLPNIGRRASVNFRGAAGVGSHRRPAYRLVCRDRVVVGNWSLADLGASADHSSLPITCVRAGRSAIWTGVRVGTWSRSSAVSAGPGGVSSIQHDGPTQHPCWTPIRSGR